MSKRILIVEDQEDLRAILCDFLSASGYIVIEAVDGADSVAKATSERHDLMLTDIQLPVRDGYDATWQIKALPLNQALAWNVRTCASMPREKPQAVPIARAKVPKRCAGAEQPVVVKRRP